jgi:pfkB family carbohydrate kinase
MLGSSSNPGECAPSTVASAVDRHLAVLRERKVLVGFDGFVDNIVTPVATRHGIGESFTPVETIEEFAELIRKGAHGKSANIELFPRLQKVGGNGPILANALSLVGCDVRYIGALGWPSPHPLFKELAERTRAISLAEPGSTTAIEFSDGKIMFGTATSLHDVTYDRILEAVSEDRFRDLIGESNIVAFVDWTMIPRMTDILTNILERILPQLSKTNGPKFFFDLADPTKRPSNELQTVLDVISTYQNFGSVCLGLNRKEADQVAGLLQVAGANEAAIDVLAREIRSGLELDVVLIHTKEGAACADATGVQTLPSQRCPHPAVKTGAGDHFNAGYILGRLLGLEPQKCLPFAIVFPSLYLGSGSSPSLSELRSLLANEKLDHLVDAFPSWIRVFHE